jgi:pimeloyl-ACP methyl ester carboxylesterase
MAGSPGAIKRLIAMNKPVDIRHLLPTISTPTLVVHRDGDRVVPVEHGRYYAQQISGAKYVELAGDDQRSALTATPRRPLTARGP